MNKWNLVEGIYLPRTHLAPVLIDKVQNTLMILMGGGCVGSQYMGPMGYGIPKVAFLCESQGLQARNMLLIKSHLLCI